jgi:predicted nucleotidyltransferase
VDVVRIGGPEPQSGLINRLAEGFAEDERILACWLHGSFGAGTTDKYSDIDMAIAVDDEQFHYALESARAIAAGAGDVLVSWDSPRDVNGAGFTCFYSDCNFLDVKVYRAPRVPSIGSKSPILVLFDRNGTAVFADQPMSPDDHLGAPPHEQIHWKMVFLCLCAYSAIRFLKREDYWYASGMINAIRGTLAQILWLWKHPDEVTDMSFIVWGVVRRDLDPELLSELASTVLEAERAELVLTLGRLLDLFERYGERIARETGAEYPERLFQVIAEFYRDECG